MSRFVPFALFVMVVACSTSREGTDAPPVDASLSPDGSRPAADTGPGDGGICTAPDMAIVGCDPLPAGAEGCTSDTGSTFGPVPGAADATYPIGCEVSFPFCLDAYPTFTAQCTCQSNAGREPSWWCPV